MDRERRGMAVLTAPPGPAPGRMAAWFGRPLASLPRMAAILALLAIAAACIWSVWATGRLIHADQQRSAALEAAQRAAPIKGATGDLGLYRAIDARMAQGQGYYHAAIAEHLAHDFPTKPFFTIRSPVLAEGTVLFGANGWRLIAITALALSLAGLIGLPPSVANTPERFAAVALHSGPAFGEARSGVGALDVMRRGVHHDPVELLERQLGGEPHPGMPARSR